MASRLSAARRMSEAPSSLYPSVQTSTRVLGPSHRLTLENRALRARALGYTGALDEAARELEAVVAEMRAASSRQSIPGAFSGRTGATARRLQDGLALGAGVAAADAGSWRNRSMARTHTERNRSDPARTGNKVEALLSLEEARSLLSHPDGRMHPDLADVFVGSGQGKDAPARFAEALPLLEKADTFWRDFAPSSQWAHESARLLAECRKALARQ